MSNRYDLEDRLLKMEGGDELVNMLHDALDDAEEEGYDTGYDDGCEESDEMLDKDKLEGHLAKALQERYEYLKRGGEWQRELLPNDEFASPADNYAAGFLDAMRLLKVKP